MDAFSLEGRVALVTGAGTGIGAAIARALAAAGADVACHGNKHAAEDTAADIRKLGRRAAVVKGDVREAATADALVEATVRELGAVDILVNNAGTIRRGPAVDFSDDDWAAVLDVNLTAVFRLCRAAGKRMLAQGRGKIVNIASLLSFQGGIRVAAYTAAKSGLLGLTRAMANELAPRGINVNAIAPGYMATDNTEALRNDPKRSAEILARIPAGRWGRPDDLAGAVVFLASPAAAYVHGAVLAVDGGWLAR